MVVARPSARVIVCGQTLCRDGQATRGNRPRLGRPLVGAIACRGSHPLLGCLQRQHLWAQHSPVGATAYGLGGHAGEAIVARVQGLPLARIGTIGELEFLSTKG
ncbi:hypothetical protein BHM03_00052044 [Ensete ventricosum]|nr:hypothetical protein BHM03_00052044 [Ensete ventricosum]